MPNTGFPEINFKQISKSYPGVDVDCLIIIFEHLKTRLKGRDVPLYIFINPDIEKLSATYEQPFASVLQSFIYLSNKFPNFAKKEAIYDRDGLKYTLQIEDLEEVSKNDSFYHPDNHDIILFEAKKYIRHAFVFRVYA